MARLMADEGFRAERQRNRYAPHVRPINELVDALREQDGRGWMPYVAPWHGGIRAKVLSVLRDPGPATQQGGGSGFLCTENDDPTAEFQARAFEAAGIQPQDLTPWNAYPWYINRAPTSRELDAGVTVLAALIGLLPDLQVVLLQGVDAQKAWKRFTKRYPTVANRFTVEATHHPGRQALWSADPAIREERRAHRIATYHKVAATIR
ncbi:uracil-DNA glycosylase [Thermomonospora cellulosilytica]|uniref:Uracil-DNA glycosylase n=1 Tax=Thermomonospora cellulosilytica TaxID=1411118 RepID=A0A7W3MYG4_9ACTN|nr:uracil-DNA glycosylase [Thermomonospora cellulosilytica]MBA9004224.1 hypothetical protein [Thermomonospora cellulosilytica]